MSNARAPNIPLTVEILTPERTVFEADDVDYVVAPGAAGDVGILPDHAPFVTPMQVGEVRIDRGGKSDSFAVSGGMLEVMHDRVQILAQSAEHEGDIDVERAHAARERAEEHLASEAEGVDEARAEAALARALNRVQIAAGEG